MSGRANVFSILLDAICCVMCADQKISRREHKTIHAILKKVKCPWTAEDVDKQVTNFLQRVKKKGLATVTEETCENLSEFKRRGKEYVLLKCVDYMVKADGIVDEKEIAVCSRFKSALTDEPIPGSAKGPSEPEIEVAQTVPVENAEQAQADMGHEACYSDQGTDPDTPGSEECVFCGGSGLCSGCNGTGKRDMATVGASDEFKTGPQKENCFMCEASGVCNMCQGRGKR